ncbi:MAG: NmrA family NAD(P)-binding protein [Bacteroidales bacterium]|jgi:uncharacterized protein YbjT (DUF2867 family)|nr:NmrA family NAD(P)-binding protein [Bacteroidales bacterium]
MIIIVGASGQIGSNIVKELVAHQTPVRAITHQAKYDFGPSVETGNADLLNTDDVIKAFKGGTTAFLLTPEKHNVEDIIEETGKIIDNYKIAIKKTGIRRIVGLSCVGAHVKNNTGNILMSRLLEQAFIEFDIEKIFVRPSYFYSNWLGYVDLMNEAGILPTFFPADLEVEMHAPVDVARFVAQCIMKNEGKNGTTVHELAGTRYSSKNIADIFAKKLNKAIQVQVISKEERIPALMSAGFTENAARNMSDMTQAVIDKVTSFEFEDKVIRLPTSFDDYLKDVLR